MFTLLVGMVVIFSAILIPSIWFFLPLSFDGAMGMRFANKNVIDIPGDVLYNLNVLNYQSDVRNISIELARGCNGEEVCIFHSIYSHLQSFDYIPSPSVSRTDNPLFTLEKRGGDCKNLAVTLCSMIRSVGMSCYASSSYKEMHVVAVATVNNTLIKVDLTSPKWKIINNTGEIWT